MILTYKFRLKDKHSKELDHQARQVNFVWNYCNDLQQKTVRAHRKWLSGYDLQKMTAGSSKDLNLHGHTIQRICMQYDQSRKTHKKAWLKFRSSKSLGWVPFATDHVKFKNEAFIFRKIIYEPMHFRDIPEGLVIKAGSFNQDSKGHWYINATLDFPDDHFPKAQENSIGIDLGLKDLATLSSGIKIENPRFYRTQEQRLKKSQRAKKKKQTRNIHQKIRNQRKDFLHKASSKLTLENNLIVVGDVSSSKLTRTRMAKSVFDVSWYSFKNMIRYKAIRHGGIMIEVNESYTTQICSDCSSISGPKGIADLGIREWTCKDCNSIHDRDINSARNILRIGLDTLVEGTFSSLGEEQSL